MMSINPRFFLLLMFSPWVPPLQAIQMDPLSLEQLREQSTVILRGGVLSKRCQRDAEGRIFTKVELEVREVWKGSVTANRFLIVHGGGVLGDKKTVVSGQVEYDIGEEVVAFLVLNQRGEGVTLGLAQGKFHVWKDPATGERLARNPFHGNSGDGDSSLEANRAALSHRLSLAELKRRVHGGAQ